MPCAVTAVNATDFICFGMSRRRVPLPCQCRELGFSRMLHVCVVMSVTGLHFLTRMKSYKLWTFFLLSSNSDNSNSLMTLLQTIQPSSRCTRARVLILAFKLVRCLAQILHYSCHMPLDTVRSDFNRFFHLFDFTNRYCKYIYCKKLD